LLEARDLSTLVDALSALRASFESAPAGQQGDWAQDQYLKFEAVRFRFINRYGPVRRAAYPDGRIMEIVYSLHEDLQRLCEDDEFMDHAGSIRARPRPNLFLRSKQPSELSFGLESLMKQRPPVSAVMNLLLRATADGVVFRDPEEAELPLRSPAADVKKLRTIVPTQKIAPVQFDIVNDRLVIAHRPSEPRSEGANIVPLAKADLIKRGNEVIDQLKRSNCDPRLLAQFDALQKAVEDGNNIIEVGLTNIVCTMIGKGYENELPAAVFGLMQAHTVGVQMYVSQFPDWVTFSEQAVSADIEGSDNKMLSKSLEHIIETISRSSDLADPEVPRTLRNLKETIDDPVRSTKRAIYAAARTLENLIIRVFQHGADFLEKTAVKTVDGLSTTASKVIVYGLLTLALSTASGLHPLASKIDGMGWIKDAAKIVQRQIEILKE